MDNLHIYTIQVKFYEYIYTLIYKKASIAEDINSNYGFILLNN